MSTLYPLSHIPSLGTLISDSKNWLTWFCELCSKNPIQWPQVQPDVSPGGSVWLTSAFYC